MIRGLTRIYSSLTIAAAAGLFMGGIALSPAQAADLGGDCCADLEERVAELEATTARKGNKKVSLKVSGQVHTGVLWWDDGEEQNVYVVDVDTSSSRFRFTGSGKIDEDWSAGFNIEIEYQFLASNVWDQFDDNGGTTPAVRRSAMYLKSNTMGTLWWGWWSMVSDDLGFIDVSGTYISGSPDPSHYAGNMFLRPSGCQGAECLSGIRLDDVTAPNVDDGLDLFFDPFGARYGVVRYDSPTFAGFTVSAAWGEDDMWDVGVRYATTHYDFKMAGGLSYGESRDERDRGAGGGGTSIEKDESFWLASASVIHEPTGLFIKGAWTQEEQDTKLENPLLATGRTTLPDADGWHVKVGVKRKYDWNTHGALAIFGWYSQINDAVCGLYDTSTPVAPGPGTEDCYSGELRSAVTNAFPGAVEATGSEVEYWGIGIHQWIDASALELYLSYMHYDVSIDLVDEFGDAVPANFDEFWTVLFGGRIRF